MFLTGDRPSEALDRARAAIDLDPQAGAAHRVLGHAYHNLGLTAKAIESYGKALQIDDRDVWAMNNLALLYIQAERFAEEISPRQVVASERPEEAPEPSNPAAGSEPGAAE